MSKPSQDPGRLNLALTLGKPAVNSLTVPTVPSRPGLPGNLTRPTVRGSIRPRRDGFPRGAAK